MKKALRLFHTLVNVTVAFSLPAFAFAADVTQGAPDVTGTSGSGLENPLGSTSDLNTLITAVLNFIVKDVGPVVITLMLVYCGFLFVAAQGNEEKLGQARTALMWTVIGAIILLGAVTIEAVISNTVSSL
jgi:hypothetical protein